MEIVDELLIYVSVQLIKQVTDWQLTEEALCQALAQLVNAISRLDVTQAWGAGKTSSSDGQRFHFKRQVLQRTYSHRFHDYALEFYSCISSAFTALTRRKTMVRWLRSLAVEIARFTWTGFASSGTA